MTIEQALNLLNTYPQFTLGFFLLIPVCVLILALGYSKGRPIFRLFDYLNSVFIYLISIPGMACLVITLYKLFFVRQDITTLDIKVYFLPFISMFCTLSIIGSYTSFNRLPGFKRLSGLMLALAILFVVLLFLYQTRILIGFFSSIETLIALIIILYILFKYAIRKMRG